MQTVSFETAKKLKEAGFPQPSDTHYDANRWCMFYVEPDEEGRCGPYSLDKIEDIRAFGDPCEVVAYAPTAIDLLPKGWGLFRLEGAWNWACYQESSEIPMFGHITPAEAAAQAWFSVKAQEIAEKQAGYPAHWMKDRYL